MVIHLTYIVLSIMLVICLLVSSTLEYIMNIQLTINGLQSVRKIIKYL